MAFAGWSAAAAKRWLDRGNDWEEARAWAAIEVPPSEVARWASDPSEAGRWIARGFGRPETAAWRKAGLSPDEASEWSTAGCDAAQAVTWVANGFDPQDAQEWTGRGFEAREAKPWWDKSFDSGEAAEWREAGFGPAEAASWAAQEVSPEDAPGWKAIDMQMSEAAVWRNLGFETPAVAAVAKAGGCGSCSAHARPDTYEIVESAGTGELLVCASCRTVCGACGDFAVSTELSEVEHPTTGDTIAGLLVCGDCASEAEAGDASFWDGIFFGDNEEDSNLDDGFDDEEW